MEIRRRRYKYNYKNSELKQQWWLCGGDYVEMEDDGSGCDNVNGSGNDNEDWWVIIWLQLKEAKEIQKNSKYKQ